MKAAIIGTGLLGEKIYQNISKFCEEIILTHNKNKKYHDSKKFDFFNDDINDIFDNKQIDLVILSAKIEFEENSEKLRNAMEHFLDTCKNSRLVYISSDGIFDGKKGMYSESDVPNPVTLYGRNLKLCENLVKEYSDNFCIVRPNYMYGIEEASIDGRMKRVLEDLKDGKEVKRFTDMYKSPMSYIQAAEAITKIALSDYVGIVHISGERMSVYDFTREILEAMKISTNNLIGEAMPKDRPFEFLPDTSLNNELMEKITDIKPLSIRENFEKYGNTVDKGILPKKYLK